MTPTVGAVKYGLQLRVNDRTATGGAESQERNNNWKSSKRSGSMRKDGVRREPMQWTVKRAGGLVLSLSIAECADRQLGPNSTTRTPATDVLYYTTNGHHQRTSSQQFGNKFATSQCQSPTSRHVKMLGCGKIFGGEFVVQQVVELL